MAAPLVPIVLGGIAAAAAWFFSSGCASTSASRREHITNYFNEHRGSDGDVAVGPIEIAEAASMDEASAIASQNAAKAFITKTCGGKNGIMTGLGTVRYCEDRAHGGTYMCAAATSAQGWSHVVCEDGAKYLNPLFKL